MNKHVNNDFEFISEADLLALADNMAAAAVSFSTHGYDQFIQSREQLKSAFHRLAVMVKIEQCEALIRGRRSTDTV